MSTRRRCGLMAALLALATLLGVSLAPPASGQGGELQMEELQLDNGLRVILVPEASVPVVNVNLWYRVGSRDERLGRSGFAHLFEHIMFEGSENVAKGEHRTRIERAGGSLNATVDTDRSLYFQTLPSHHLNLALWLEAERLRGLDVSQENLENQREVVKEEKRLRILEQPYASSVLEAQYDVTYDPTTCFAQAHSPIGSLADLDAAELADVRAFHELYYRPNNATLVVAGDFDPGVARTLVEEYFGDIPAGPAPPRVVCEEPFGHLPTRHVEPDRNAMLPAVIMAFGAVEQAHADAPALALLGRILGDGEASRLHQRLVERERAAVASAAFANLRVDPGVVLLFGIANQGVDAERLEGLLEEEVARVGEEGVTAKELERARNQVLAGRAFEQQTVMGLAQAVQHAAFFYGDPAAVATIPALYEAVTLEDLKRVARRYLAPANRATVITQPAGAGVTPPEGPAGVEPREETP